MSIRSRLTELVWHKTWTPKELDKYIGQVRGCYFTYAADEALRVRAASGGSVSALLLHLLTTRQVDGVLVCRTVISDGKPRPEFFIAETQEQLIEAQGSKYTAVYFTAKALPLIKAYEGRLAVVALPCDAKLLAHYRTRHPEVDEKIICVFTLFCGHNSEPILVDHIVEKLGRGHGPLTEYIFKHGHWRGKLKATYEDGTVVEKAYKYVSDYRSLHFFSQAKCHHCFDHYGYYCDISAGDIWSPEMKALPIKHTALLPRTETGMALLQEAVETGVLIAQEEALYKVANGQARGMPSHYNITSRSRVGRLFGLKIKDQTHEKVRWNNYLVAFIVLLNERLTRKQWGQRLVFALPRPLLRFYLYILKGLESI